MPIEIKELVIRAVVGPQPGGSRSSGCMDGKHGGQGQDHDAIVQACVDETLRILRRQRER